MRILKQLDTLAMCLALWALFFVVALQFFTRYVLNDSYGWTEEIARMLLIVVTYLGAVVCARNDSHIRVDLFLYLLPDKIRNVTERFFDLVSASLFLFLSWTAFQFAQVTRLKMTSVDVSKSVIFWICAVALLFMAFHYLIHLFSRRSDSSGDTTLPRGI